MGGKRQVGHTFEPSISLKLRPSLKDRTVSTKKTLGGTSPFPSHQKKKYRDKCEVFNLGLKNEHIYSPVQDLSFMIDPHGVLSSFLLTAV